MTPQPNTEEDLQQEAEERPRFAWWWYARDAVLVTVGVFMLLWETVGVRSAQPILIAAAIACFGLPVSGVIQRALLGDSEAPRRRRR